MNAFPTGFAAVGNGFIRSGACVGLAPAALCVGANCVRLRTVREAGPYEGLQGRFAGERLPLEGKLAAVRLTDEVF